MRICIALFLMAGAVWAQDLCTDVAAINKFAKELTTASYRKPQLRYELSLSEDNAKWHMVRRWGQEGVTNVAIVYAGKAEAPLKVWMSFGSDSGDWNQEVEFYFRADGSLAKRYDYLATFYGNVKARRKHVVRL